MLGMWPQWPLVSGDRGEPRCCRSFGWTTPYSSRGTVTNEALISRVSNNILHKYCGSPSVNSMVSGDTLLTTKPNMTYLWPWDKRKANGNAQTCASSPSTRKIVLPLPCPPGPGSYAWHPWENGGTDSTIGRI